MNRGEFRVFFDALAHDSKYRAKECREETRDLLRKIRDGEATRDEINAVTNALRFMQTKLFNAENERQGYVLTSYHLSPEHPTMYDLAEATNCSTKTVERDRELGIERLSILLFGTDAVAWK